MAASAVVGSLGKALRAMGQALDTVGRSFEVMPYVEKLQPSTRAMRLGPHIPVITNAFVAPTATVIGQVTVGSRSSIWYGAVLRGDVNTITIGDGVTIGDRAMVHCSSAATYNKPTVIGNHVVVGAGVIVHGATLADESMVGEGAQVLDGATVQKHAIVAPGALVPMGKVVPSGQLWAGVPAVYVRDVTVAEVAHIATTATENMTLAAVHAAEAAKGWEVVEEDEYNWQQAVRRNESYWKRLSPEQMSYKLGELEHHQVGPFVSVLSFSLSLPPPLLNFASRSTCLCRCLAAFSTRKVSVVSAFK